MRRGHSVCESGAVPAHRLLLPADPAARRRRDRWLLVLAVLLAAGLVARAARKEAGVLLRNQEWGARFAAGGDPYFDPAVGHRVHGPYPPSFALVAVPLSTLPTRAARVVWATAQIGALGALLALLRGRLRRHWPDLAPHGPMVFGLALLLASRYVLRDMAGGGGNLLYVTLALAGLELGLDRRAGRAALAGVPLALGLLAKPNLVLLAAFWAARGRWRPLAATAVAAAFLAAVPALAHGPRGYAALWERWSRDVAAYAALDDLHASALVPDGMPAAENGMNQSLREAVHRVLRPPGDSGAPDVSVLTTSPRTATWIARGLALALLGAGLLGARRVAREDEDGGRAEWLAALAFLPLSLLLSPITWKAHHAALLPLFGALVALALAPGARRRGLGVALVAYYLACDLASRELLGKPADVLLQTLAVVTWADVALFLGTLALAGAFRRTPRAARSPGRAAPAAGP